MRFPALILAPVLALGLTAAHAAGLPDSGQDKCYDGSNVLVACTNANTADGASFPRQDGRFGRDAKAAASTLAKIGGGAAGFDYSKIANNGSDLGAGVGLALGTSPTAWACTRDNITGLAWEVKVNDATHLRHRNWTYTWYSSDGGTNAGYAGTPSGTSNCKAVGRCDTEKFVADVNASALCGYNDWRMPTQRELGTLVHAGSTQDPAVDSTYFPNTADTPGSIESVFRSVWSGSSYAVDRTYAWIVYFFDGNTTFTDLKSSANYVRLVRGGRF